MSPSPEDFPKLSTAGQLAVFWRILHLTTVVWGNFPAGQLLTALTMTFLHNRDMNPTVSDLCKATGLPKATVSRYVSWQLSHGLAKEVIDPHDRRRRTLHRTKQGQKAWAWQTAKVSELFSQITEQSDRFRHDGSKFDPGDLLSVMKGITKAIESEDQP